MDRRKGKVHEVSEAELRKALEPTDDERRSNARVPVKLEVDVPLANWEQVRTVYTTNISKGGMLFSLTSPASVPAAVELTLALPDGSKVTLQSEVRHVARREGTPEFDVGVQFQELDPKTRDAFEQALARIGRK
ncbi:MAG TPA: PilZ domain-containing protein [Polyangia bacterium]|nr:PilZ domain-containing protein [Polyangia bacterium]